MNKNEMMLSKIRKIKTKLDETDYDNYAHRNNNLFPLRLKKDFKELLRELETLVNEASMEFPDLQVKELFEKGKESLDPRNNSEPVKSEHFNKGKEMLSEVIRSIEKKYLIIFVSCEDEQIFKAIQDVLDELGVSYSQITTEQNQSNILDTVINRINEIRECTGTIICLPPQNSSNASSNLLTYLDLGVCLANFPNKLLLIHQENNLPDDLTNEVKTFKYAGNSMSTEEKIELKNKIIEVL